ncbi:MAG TPA: BTAD domain-containing putative transcriptional regulator [Pseudonocardia sp.]
MVTEPDGPSFGLLGPVAAVGADGSALALGPPRRRAVLAALLVHAGAGLTVDELVALLWRDVVPASAGTMVHNAVAGLRRTLEPAGRSGEPGILVTRGGRYTLLVDPERVDATGFERLLADGRRLLRSAPERASRTLADALALWRGPALAGVEEAFARDAAARWDELRVTCAELRLDAELRAGRHARVVAEAEDLLRRHPTRETVCAHLMVALYRGGRQAEALNAYHAVRRTLADELGLRPGPELRRLQAAVLRQGPELDRDGPVDGVAAGTPPRRRGCLPAPLGSFVGRTGAAGRIAMLLGEHRLVTLSGPGGAGKTRLALESARLAEDAGAEVFFVPLAPCSDPDLVVQTVAESVGARADAGRDLVETVAAALSGADAVLLLDNCEHLLDACAGVARALLATAGRVRVLATSREPLGVPGEQVRPVGPLPLAGSGEGWRRIAGCDAVRLFAARAASARPGFAVTAENAELVLEVCRRLDGLPLALELAAARAASMPLAELAARLHDRFRLLAGAARGGDPRHHGLAPAVAWSVDLLTGAERELLLRLAVFPGSFDLAAAEALGAGGAVPAGDVALALARLVHRSVVRLDDEPGGGGRYRLLETTREFARSVWAPGAGAGLRRRHAEYHLGRASEAERHLFRAASGRWLTRLHRDRADLRAALGWAFGPGGDREAGVRLVRCLWHYWDLRGARAEGLRWVHAALDGVGGAAAGPDGVDTGRPADRIPLLSAAALLHLGRAEFDRTSACAAEQLVLARAGGDRAGEGDALAMAATVAWARGRYDQARLLYEDAVAALLDGGDLWRAAMAEAQLGRLHRDRGEPDAAWLVARRSLAHAEEAGEELARGLALDVLASLEQRWGDPAEARRLVGRALGRYRLVRYREGEASALHLAGRIALGAGDRGAARAAFERSLRVFREIGHRAGAAGALEGLAAVAGEGADGAEAADLLGAAAALRTEIGVPRPA